MKSYDRESLASLTAAEILKLARDGHLDEQLDPGITQRRAEQAAVEAEAQQAADAHHRQALTARTRAREAAYNRASLELRKYLNRNNQN